MHNNFKDITSKLGDPIWYDRLGYPRYCVFHPREVSNIYADVVIYFRIGCQGCRKKFLVAESITVYNLWETKMFKEYFEKEKIGKNESLTKHIVPFFKTLSVEAISNYVHYGDPPNHGCVGDTMNCEDLQIEQFWTRSESRGWKRVQDLEINLIDLVG